MTIFKHSLFIILVSIGCLGITLQAYGGRDSPYVTTYTYHASSNQVVITDPEGYATQDSYQSYGNPSSKQLIQIRSPLNVDTNIKRNAIGKIQSIQEVNAATKQDPDPKGLTRTFKYNSNHFLKSVNNPETGKTKYGRDAIGLLKTSQVGTSGVTKYTYNQAGLLESITYPKPNTANISQTYYPDKALKTTQSSNATWSYLYNADDEIKQSTLKLPIGNNYTIRYTYNATGLDTVTYPDGLVVTYDANGLGQYTEVLPFIPKLDYYSNGKLYKIYDKDDSNTYIEYVRDYRGFTDVIYTPYPLTFNSHYNHNADGDVTCSGENFPVGKHINYCFGYDADNRLHVIKTYGNHVRKGTISYDTYGNIKSVNFGKIDINYHYNKSTNLLTSLSGSINSNIQYNNPYGNITHALGNTYTFNDAEQLIEAGGTYPKDNGKAYTVMYTYDPNGHVLTTTVIYNGKVYQPVLTIFNRAGELLERINPNNDKTTDFIYVKGMLVAEDKYRTGHSPTNSSNFIYFVDNELDSPVVAFNKHVSILWNQAYLPYGKELINNAVPPGHKKTQNNQSIQHIGYTGKLHSALTHLTNMGARQYSATLGRFLSIDPAPVSPSNPFSFNRYMYANDNPYSFTDPTGMFSLPSWTHLFGFGGHGHAFSGGFNFGSHTGHSGSAHAFKSGFVQSATANIVHLAYNHRKHRIAHAIGEGIGLVAAIGSGDEGAAAVDTVEDAADTATRFISDVKVTNMKTGEVTQGTEDLKPTLDRINSGEKLSYRNDGTTFRNHEGLLPSKPDGYYTEYVHPTAGIDGPGPQRIVTGASGETYYTPDHYQSFIEL